MPIRYLFIYVFVGTIVLLSQGCIQGGGSSRRGIIKDFTVTTTAPNTGCGTSQYVEFSTDLKSYSCSAACPTSTHIATTTEVNNFKTTNTDPTILSILEGSLNLCVLDSSAARPSGEVYVSTDFCSCLNGKADIINDCDTYCANIATSTTPLLHVNTTLGSSIANNTKLGSLFNWCNIQLDGDVGTPQCTLTATDGTNTVDGIPVTISKAGNSFTADISGLSYNTTYVVTLVESKTGSNATSTDFQIRRVRPPTNVETAVGAIKITPVSQYTCLNYGGTVDANGTITRTSYVKAFYYFPANESPAPIPPPGGTSQSQTVCHDEISNPGADNSLYPRLELIPSAFTLWDKTEARFVKVNNVMTISTTILNRLYDEYSVTLPSLDLFSPLNYLNRPSTISSSSSSNSSSIVEGFMMVPFINNTTNKAFCPTTVDFLGTDPKMKILKDYIGDTEGLYLGEKEPVSIQDPSSGYKTVYGTMFVTENILSNYGFYLTNGLKVKATKDSLHNKTIYYYWPVNSSMDPLQQGDRSLFTVRYYDQLNGNTPTGVPTTIRTSDKRIGCIPKT
jgi:hypothetical protein